MRYAAYYILAVSDEQDRICFAWRILFYSLFEASACSGEFHAVTRGILLFSGNLQCVTAWVDYNRGPAAVAVYGTAAVTVDFERIIRYDYLLFFSGERKGYQYSGPVS